MFIALTLGLILLSLVLFITEWIRYDVVALLVLLILHLSGILSMEEAFSGFSNPAVITVAAVLVMSRSVQNSGVLHVLGTYLIRWGKTPGLLTAIIMLAVGSISGFINDIGTAALFMPLILMVSRKIGTPPSKFLIPLSYGCLLGGTLTMIGTPPNILITLFMAERGYEPFTMFDFTPIGIIVLVAGIIYMVLIGRHLLPSRRGETNLMDRFEIREYLTELVVGEESSLAGLRLDEISAKENPEFTVLGIIREQETRLTPNPWERIKVGDVILAETNPGELEQLTGRLNVKILPNVEPGEEELSSEEVEVVEAVVMPDSQLVGYNLRQFGLRRRYGINLLAVSRQNHPIRRRLAEVQFRAGDVLLVQGSRSQIDTTLAQIGCLPLADRRISVKPGAHPYRVLAIFLGVILLASFELVHISIAFTLGAFLMIVGGCISLRGMYESIEWPILILMAGMIPLGSAMVSTGTATWLADGLVSIAGSSNPYLILGLLYFLVAALTSVLNNPTVAVIMSPIALDLSTNLNVSPLPFFMLTAVAASCAFLSPVSHKANVLVWGPGGYRFSDYTKVGLPLTILIGIISVLVIPILWPF